MSVFDLLPVAFRLLSVKGQIERLIEVGKPVLEEARKAAPEAIPLIRTIVGQVWPDVLKQIDGAGEPGDLVRFDVTWLQESLNKLGERLEVDGDYGEATHAAVRKFQEKHGLEADSWAGPQTCTAIYSALHPVPGGQA